MARIYPVTANPQVTTRFVNYSESSATGYVIVDEDFTSAAVGYPPAEQQSNWNTQSKELKVEREATERQCESRADTRSA